MVSKCRTLRALFIAIFIFLILSGCSNNVNKVNNQPTSKTEFVLGTVATIKIYGDVDEDVFNKAFEKLREIEKKMTINADKSEVIEINTNAGNSFVKVSDDTFYVIERGKYFSELSKGRFDISIGPLVKLWNIGTEYQKVPDEDMVINKKALVDYNNVILNEAEKSVMLKKQGMMLDLGGIAKGYGTDEVAKILRDNNVKHAIINLGGNVFAYGNKYDGTSWRIGIQNPFLSRGDYVGVVEVADQTIVTSGVYERYFEQDGKRYHHILDTDTGYPVNNNLAGISIIASSSIDADSLSTSAFALGLEKGIELIEKMDNVDAVFVTDTSQVYITSGLKDKFELRDEKFKLMN